jgi:hypothetical protein
MKNKIGALIKRLLRVKKQKDLTEILSTFNKTITELSELSKGHRGKNTADQTTIQSLQAAIGARAKEASRADEVAERLKALVA